MGVRLISHFKYEFFAINLPIHSHLTIAVSTVSLQKRQFSLLVYIITDLAIACNFVFFYFVFNQHCFIHSIKNSVCFFNSVWYLNINNHLLSSLEDIRMSLLFVFPVICNNFCICILFCCLLIGNNHNNNHRFHFLCVNFNFCCI